MSLQSVYRSHGISFRYPTGWEVSHEHQDDAFTVTASNDGNFWSLTSLKRRPPVSQVLDEATEAFEEEYEEVDLEAVQTVLCGKEAEGRTLEFVALELISCVSMCAAQVGGRTLFVLSQVVDHEREQYDSIFEEMTASVAVAPDEEIEIE